MSDKCAADEKLLLNAQEVANQLRHLADNEIDSDSFAVVTENYNGRETEFERPITDLAIDAANLVDAMVEALELREKRILELLAERDADKRRIEELQYELGRYSMSAGEADQRRCESRAARDALGFGKDADDVSPSDLRQRIAELEICISQQRSIAAHNLDMFRRADARIAELEARTLTVKLPTLNPQMFNDDVMFGYRKAQREAVEYCAAAGISLKIEGE